MQQYSIETATMVDETIQLNKEQAHHIAHVMRMKEGERIRIADANAHLYYASVVYEGNDVKALIQEGIADHTKNAVQITLLQGMIKGEKWDYLLQKSAELGVDRLVPFVSSRCVVKSKEEKLDKKMQRWNKILQEGCEQCKRSTQVNLTQPQGFANLVHYKSDLNLIAYEDADRCSERLVDVLKQYPNSTSVSIVIGPEGGFSKEEVTSMVQAGFHRVSLGERILRAETAALSMTNSIAFYYDMAGEKE